MKIGVYYIATGKYKHFFKNFLNSLHNFFPEDEKIVYLISDGLEEYDGHTKYNIKVKLCPRINHYPWPIVTLYKHWHILENFDKTCDYICYFNGNSVIYKNNPEEWFDKSKLTVSLHSFGPSYNVWSNLQLDKGTEAYLKNETYTYVHGGFFIGPTVLAHKLCTDIVNMLHKDMAKHLFAQWHDESYVNKWCVDNSNEVNIKQIMTVYESDLNDTTFVHLPAKDYHIQNKISLLGISD